MGKKNLRVEGLSVSELVARAQGEFPKAFNILKMFSRNVWSKTPEERRQEMLETGQGFPFMYDYELSALDRYGLLLDGQTPSPEFLDALAD